MIRHEMGWNIKEAALACGFPAGTWREWELRGRDPRGLADIAEKIAARTGADEYWLMTGKMPPGDTPHPRPGQPSLLAHRKTSKGRRLPWVDSNHQPSGYRHSQGVTARIAS